MKLKLVVFIIMLLTVFVIFIYFYNKESNYLYNYEVKEYEISEEYDTKTQKYYFLLKNNDIEYHMEVNGEYSNARGLVEDIKEFEDEKNPCITISGQLEFYIVCKDVEKQYFFHELKDDKIIEEYNGIDIYNYPNKNFLIWNYKGFYYINEEKQTEINLLKNDKYLPNLNLIVDGKLFMPNYDDLYYFDKYYLIDFQNGKYSEHELNKEISLDSKYMSYEDNILRLYDDLLGKAYDITVGTEEVKTINGIDYENQADSNNKLYYQEDDLIYYKYKNKKIYINYNEVTEILYQKEEEVIFLSSGKVFLFNPSTGLKLLFESEQWKFNYNEIFYID